MSDELDVPDWVPGAGWAGFGALGTLWLLGPSIRAVGRNLGKWTDYHTSNLLSLSEKVERRLRADGDEADDHEVHPRVAKEVMDAAAWVDDDLHQEYLAALLVGARSPGGRDDAAMYDVKLVTSLPAAAVRLHYALYSSYFGTVPSLKERAGRTFLHVSRLERLTLSAPVGQLTELTGSFRMLGIANDALHREGLIHAMAPVAGVDEVQYVPNGFGASLFKRAFFTRQDLNTDVLLLPIEQAQLFGHTPAPDGPRLETVRIGPARPSADISM